MQERFAVEAWCKYYTGLFKNRSLEYHTERIFIFIFYCFCFLPFSLPPNLRLHSYLWSASRCPNQIAHLIFNVSAIESLSPLRSTSDLPDTLTTLHSLFSPHDLSFCLKNVRIKDAFVHISPACDILTKCLPAEWNSFTVWVRLSVEGQDLGFRRKWIG